MPDLDVQNAGDSYPPYLSASSVVAGGSVTLTYRLSNFGLDSAPSSVTGIYRSTDSTISTSDARIGTAADSSLSANTGQTETFTIDTTGWAAGSYYIGAVADYNNAISESNESNNPSSGVWLTVTAPPVQLPDLDVQNAGDSYPPTLSASSVVAGGSVTLTYRLSNFGLGSAPSSVTGIYRSTDGTISTSDTRIGTDANSSLSADTGRTETFTIDTTGWAAGSYYIGAVADYNNAISESNESNNPSSGVWLTVTAPPVQLPDLDVQNAGDSYPPTLSASSVVAGGSVTLTYRLSNFGLGSAPSSVTGIYRSTDGTISTSDTRIGTDANSSLSADTGRTETFTIDTTGWAAGSYYIGAVADYNNAISESNESNNPSSGVWLTVTAPSTDTTAPVVSSYAPSDNSTGVAVGANLVLTFNEAVQAGSGNVVIYNSNGTVFRTIAVTDTTQVTFSGSTMTINPAVNLAAGVGYYVQMASGAVRDSAGNNFAGITSTTQFNFTTASGTTDAGNTLATATALTLGGTVSQSVGIGTDTDDYFRFTATANGRVTANLTGLSADIDLRALNSAETQIVAGELGGTSSESVTFDVVAGQTYYLKVDPYGAVSSNYSLATSFTPTATTEISVLYPFAGSFAVTQTATGTYSHTDDPANSTNPDYWTAAYDFGAPVGTPVLAVAGGTVVSVYEVTANGQVGPGHGQGNFVTILFNPGTQNQFYGTFAHLSYDSVRPAVGQDVVAGEVIALSGNTGSGTGAHLHFGYSTTSYTHPTSTPALPIIFANATDAHDNLITFGGVRPSLNQLVSGQLTGGSGDDTISGTAVANAIAGRGGADTLNGLGGDDFIFGGLGNDILTGGSGRDTFVFTTAPDSTNVDSISDFSVADDTIWLRRTIFSTAGASGALSAAAFKIGSVAADADDRIVYDSTTGALIYDSNGNAAEGAVQFATLEAGLALTAADFFIF